MQLLDSMSHWELGRLRYIVATSEGHIVKKLLLANYDREPNENSVYPGNCWEALCLGNACHHNNVPREILGYEDKES